MKPNSRPRNNKKRKKGFKNSRPRGSAGKYSRFASMGRLSMTILNRLYDPLDAVNRFINLSLQHVEEDSQHRQFLLESKSGIRKLSSLLCQLNRYAKKMETEFARITQEEIE
ncbi:MAG: hypothetical protein ISS34_03960 [Candidatus Omnitrophica bacterium]|nr:hypothetical protein [Candidatus Omnitrophota bacterium]